MSEHSEISIKKPLGKGPHDVVGDADRASLLPNGRQRMIAIFETVAQQIKHDITRMEAASSKEEAIEIVKATYNEYQKNREAVIDKLDRLVKS